MTYRDARVAVVVPAHNEETQIGRVLETMPDSGEVVLVVHSGPIRAVLAIALDRAPEQALRFVIDPLSLTRLDRIAGLASGRGVYDNIEQGYRFLMQHWRGPQDRIFCFGFSRGAFTARCIVGMVNLFGLLHPEHETLLPTLVRVYFSQPPEEEQRYDPAKRWRRKLARWMHVALARPNKAGAEAVQGSEEATRTTRSQLAEQVRLNFARKADVHWVGVWDTVESVGLPLLFSRDNPATATFLNKPRIHHVRHALALDEHRWPFLPRVYDSPSAGSASAFARCSRHCASGWTGGMSAWCWSRSAASR